MKVELLKLQPLRLMLKLQLLRPHAQQKMELLKLQAPGLMLKLRRLLHPLYQRLRRVFVRQGVGM
jgi:hypothetical protein